MGGEGIAQPCRNGKRRNRVSLNRLGFKEFNNIQVIKKIKIPLLWIILSDKENDIAFQWEIKEYNYYNVLQYDEENEPILNHSYFTNTYLYANMI